MRSVKRSVYRLFNCCREELLQYVNLQGGHALGEYTTSDEAIAGQVDVLLDVICPESEDPDFCMENLPALWGALSKAIFSEYWQ